MARKTPAKKSSGSFSHPDYDAAVLDCFLEKQLQLFPEIVAETPEEAADFLGGGHILCGGGLPGRGRTLSDRRGMTVKEKNK